MRPGAEAVPNSDRRSGKEQIGNGLPENVVIHPNGHRRWATMHGVAIAKACDIGVENLADIFDYAAERGIKNLTLGLVSPKNIQERNTEEKDAWYGAVKKNLLDTRLYKLIAKGVSVRVFGRLTRGKIPDDIIDGLKSLQASSSENTGMTITFIANYDADTEREDGEEIAKQAGEKSFDDNTLKRHLDRRLPNPDWAILTGGTKKPTTFMPLQTLSTPYDFVDILWPDFTTDKFKESLDRFSNISKIPG